MNEGIHLDLDTWIVPDQIRKANLCRGLGNRCLRHIYIYIYIGIRYEIYIKMDSTSWLPCGLVYR